MEGHPLLEDFHLGKRGPQLPFVLNDEVEVVEGVYAGRRGTVEILAYAESPFQYPVDLGDGTDELLPAGSLKLLIPAA